MEYVVEISRIVAWPAVVVVFLFVLRRGIVRAMVKRVRDKENGK